MYSASIPDAAAQGVLPPSSIPPGAGLPTTAEATGGYDADLLVAALEDIESRRAAIEWLLEADLLCACMVDTLPAIAAVNPQS